MLELVDSLDLKSSGIYSRGGSSPPEATRLYIMSIIDRNKSDFIKNILAIDSSLTEEYKVKNFRDSSNLQNHTWFDKKKLYFRS